MTSSIVAIVLIGLAAVVTASNDPSKAEWEGKPWLGRWVSSDKQENWDAFVRELALPEQYSGLHKTIHTIWKEGDHFHHELNIPDKNWKNEVEFRLGQDVEINHHGNAIKLKYSEEGDKLVADVHIVGKNKHIHDVYHVQGNQLIKSYKIGNVEAKRWYNKEAHH